MLQTPESLIPKIALHVRSTAAAEQILKRRADFFAISLPQQRSGKRNAKQHEVSTERRKEGAKSLNAASRC